MTLKLATNNSSQPSQGLDEQLVKKLHVNEGKNRLLLEQAGVYACYQLWNAT